MVTRNNLMPKRITINGKVAELTQARKAHKCDECGDPIVPHSDYYKLTIGGGGLGSIKFPERIHVHCVDEYSETGEGK